MGKIAKGDILSFGQNHYPSNSNNNTHTIHAEHDAINKLPFKRRKTSVNMLVLRFTKTYKLCMSKPCDQCVHRMIHLFPKKGYIIKDVYYSNANGKIEKTTLTKLTGTTCATSSSSLSKK